LSVAEIKSWRDVQAEVLNRIHSRQWKPGDLIPNESDLALEFGCARATVNRALRAIAEAGLLDRRRKAGTRVTLHPVRKATLNIPIIRQEIEEQDQTYSCVLVTSQRTTPPQDVRTPMRLTEQDEVLHVRAVHMANGQPYADEDRWINIAVVPQVLEVDFSRISANEWLVANAPFTHGDIMFSASPADKTVAKRLGAKRGNALFVIDRTTWDGAKAITQVRLTFRPGYRMRTTV